MLYRVLFILIILLTVTPAHAQEAVSEDCLLIYTNAAFAGFLEMRMFNLQTHSITIPTQPDVAYMPEAVFSPNGIYAAYLWPDALDESGMGSTDHMTLYVESLQTGEQTMILSDVIGFNPVIPPAIAWSPDGEKIAFLTGQATDAGLEPVLLTANRDGSEQLLTTLNTTLTDTSLIWYEDFLIVGGGFLQTSDHMPVPEGAIPSIPTPTTAAIPTTIPPFPVPEIAVDSLDIVSAAPDQRTAVFTYSNNARNEQGLVVYAPELGLAGTLKIESAWRPVWSSDGSRLAYTRWVDDYHLVLEVLDVREFRFTHIATLVNNSMEYYGMLGWSECS